MAQIASSPCDEGVILSQADRAPCPPQVGRWVLAATILGSSMAFIDGTVVNVALPVLQSDLGATAAGVQWVVQAYALFLAALILVGGSMGDHFGRRRIFTSGILLFAVASLGCGLAQSINQLIVARIIQGIGGALLVPSSLALISATFSQEQRGQAIGTWSGFTAITTAIGPVLGGWLVETISWRAVFFINLPLAALVLAITLWRVPESRDEEVEQQLDWKGALLATLGLSGIVYGLTESTNTTFADPLVLGSLTLGIVMFLLFLYVETRVAEPMMPPGLFRSRTFSGANLLTLLLYAALGATLYYFPFNLIQVQGYSPTAAGAALLPFVLLMFLLSRWSGGLVKRFGAKRPLILGPVIVAAGFLLFSRPGIGGSYWTTFFPAVTVLGLGMALSVAPLTTTVMNAVATRQSGTASGINNAVSRLAQLMGLAVMGIAMFTTFNAALDNHLSTLNLAPETQQFINQQRSNLADAQIPNDLSAGRQATIEQAIDESFIAGFRVVMWLAAGLALVSALSSWRLIE